MKISTLSYAAASALLAASWPSSLVTAQESSVRGSSSLPISERTLEAPVLLAEVNLADNVKVSFYKSVGDSIVLSTVAPQEGGHHERLVRLLREGTSDQHDPISLYGRLKGAASGKDGSDTAPPAELATAWEKVQSLRSEKQAAAIAAKSLGDTKHELPAIPATHTHAKKSDVKLGPQNRRDLQSAWWIDNYCSDYGLDPYACDCSHYLTGDYLSYVYADEIYFHVIVAGTVGQGVVGIDGSNYYSLYYQTVQSGEIGTINTWAAYDSFGAYVKYGYGDVYHVSLYAVEDSYGYNTCTAGW